VILKKGAKAKHVVNCVVVGLDTAMSSLLVKLSAKLQLEQCAHSAVLAALTAYVVIYVCYVTVKIDCPQF